MLHYKTHVLGPKHDWVVFLHGLGGNSNIWYRQVAEFRRHYNLLFIDLRGHGKSADYKPEIATYNAEILSKDIVTVLDSLSIEKAHFAGISLGAVLLHGMHIYAPHRVISMVLGGAIIRFTPFAKVLLKIGDLIKGFVPYMWLYKLFARVLMPRKRHEESRNLFINEAKMLRRKEFIRWYKFAAKVPAIYPQVDTEKYAIPKLYIMGDQDYMFVGPVQQDTAKDKSASVHIIEECGHVCNVEKYKEFNQKAINFFKEQELLKVEEVVSQVKMKKCMATA